MQLRRHLADTREVIWECHKLSLKNTGSKTITILQKIPFLFLNLLSLKRPTKPKFHGVRQPRKNPGWRMGEIPLGRFRRNSSTEQGSRILSRFELTNRIKSLLAQSRRRFDFKRRYWWWKIKRRSVLRDGSFWITKFVRICSEGKTKAIWIGEYFVFEASGGRLRVLW